MQAQFPCGSHEGQQAMHVCIDRNCKQSKIFCKKCIANHPSHQVISFLQFRSNYEQYQSLFEQGTTKIKTLFNKTRDTFALCIKRAEERVMKEFMPFCHSVLPKLNQLEAQQLFGLATQLCCDQKFYLLATSGTSKQMQIKNQQFLLSKLQVYIDEMNSSIMAAINQMMSQLILTTTSASKPVLSEMKGQQQSQFKFSEEYKPKQYEISEYGKCLTRTNQMAQGLTMYAIVDQPLSKVNKSISFTIVQQNQRFIYFGVCDREVFKKFNFRGPVYEIGNRMYAIRQSSKQGGNAITLHNSIKQYSNMDNVLWDFQKGDIITLEYKDEKNSLLFINNSKLFFQMPLDKQTNKFYPFVGLKHQYDCVRIIKNGQSSLKNLDSSMLKNQNKGFFSSFYEKKM